MITDIRKPKGILQTNDSLSTHLSCGCCCCWPFFKSKPAAIRKAIN
jgi:hypothetical protein